MQTQTTNQRSVHLERRIREGKTIQELAADRPIRNLNLEQVVEVTMSKVGVTGENVKKGILEALADGNQNAGLTQWGLMNSFTAAAGLTFLVGPFLL